MNDYNCEKDCPYSMGRTGGMEEKLSEDTLLKLSELFKVISDPTRVRILWTLHHEEKCVCDIASMLNMTQSAVSHQLRILKAARMVRYRKEGKTVYYSLEDDHIFVIFESGMQHVEE